MTSAPHLAASTIAGLIDRTLPSNALREAELHLSGCDLCREELASCARLANSVPVPIPRRRPWPWVGAAAAVVVLAIGIRSRPPGREERPALERAPVSDANRIAIVAPLAGAIVPRSGLQFVWRRDDKSTGYRIIVTDVAGAPLWTKDLSDTSVTLPANPVLSSQARYYWRIEALHADGSAAQSATMEFRVAP